MSVYSNPAAVWESSRSPTNTCAAAPHKPAVYIGKGGKDYLGSRQRVCQMGVYKSRAFQRPSGKQRLVSSKDLVTCEGLEALVSASRLLLFP